jgi:hypothetical protein
VSDPILVRRDVQGAGIAQPLLNPPTVIAAIDIEIASDFLGKPGQRAGFILIAGLLAGFLFIRTSARLIRDPDITWWPGNVETSSGLHIHHLVWGIVTIMATGFLMFSFQPDSPWAEILAGLFGIGCGLTLDEFALWLHLEDVYWAKEGRSSVDAVVVAVLIGGLLVLGFSPFDSDEPGSVIAIATTVAFNMAFVVVAIGKGKLFSAIAGTFVPPIAMVAAVRLAKPESRWAKHRYAPGSRKFDRAQARDKRNSARQNRLLDLIGGAPSTGADDGRDP